MEYAPEMEAKELERMGAHFLAIKDMAGLCRPYAAHKLVKTLKEEVGLPIHFHTHDTSGIAAASVLRAADAGVDVVVLARRTGHAAVVLAPRRIAKSSTIVHWRPAFACRSIDGKAHEEPQCASG